MKFAAITGVKTQTILHLMGFVEPLVSRVAKKEPVNEQLISLRACLLPMLVNGWVSLK